MALEIVWRNPLPPSKGEGRVEPLVVDEFGSLYAVLTVGQIVAFEVILDPRASNQTRVRRDESL